MRLQVYLLDKAPQQCAEMYSDEHLVPSISVLIAVLQAVDEEEHPFKKHILTRWCGGSAEYSWVGELIEALIAEAIFRFGVDFTKERIQVYHLMKERYTRVEPRRWLQLIPKVVQGQPVQAYQEFYCSTQQGATWTKRGAPSWFKAPEQRAITFN